MFFGINKYLIIDIGGVIFGTPYKIIALFAVNQTTEGLAYLFLVEFPRYLRLYLHYLVGTSEFYLFGHVVFKFVGGGILFVTISEAA